MADRIYLLSEKLDHNGLFDFNALYSFAHFWLKEDNNYDVLEERYNEKAGSSGRDIHIKWSASKKVSDYFAMELKIEIEIKGMTDVEVEIDGQKKKMNKGKISFNVKGALSRDPDNKWDLYPFYRFIKDVYNKYIIPGRVDYFKKDVIKEGQELKEEIKNMLESSGRRLKTY